MGSILGMYNLWRIRLGLNEGVAFAVAAGFTKAKKLVVKSTTECQNNIPDTIAKNGSHFIRYNYTFTLECSITVKKCTWYCKW